MKVDCQKKYPLPAFELMKLLREAGMDLPPASDTYQVAMSLQENCKTLELTVRFTQEEELPVKERLR